jgi:hypothetical protein
MKTPLITIVYGFAILGTVASAQSVISSVRHSDTGFGQIDYQPGANVSQFVIYGTGTPYAYSSGTTLSTTVSGDGTSVNAGGYTATYFTWTDGVSGTTAGASGTTYNQNNMGGVQALSSGYGTTPWTTAGISLTAPASSFTVELFVHDYYANASLGVLLNGQTIGTFESIMSSAAGRNTDFLFRETFSGLTLGDTVGLTFYDLQNLGSSWANIDLFAASVDLILPTSVENLTPTSLTNVSPVPEPSTLALAGLGGLGLFLKLRRRK